MTAADPISYLVTAARSTFEGSEEYNDRILSTISLAAKASVMLVQIREKELNARQLFELASAAAAITRGTQTKLFVNGRFDVAIAAGADGVHLPENGIPVAVVRRSCPKRFMVGSSVHSIESARDSEKQGADFLLFGPVFDSGSKLGVGLASLRAVCDAISGIPVIGIGGINGSNVDSVLDAGAAGYASIRYLNDHSVLNELR